MYDLTWEDCEYLLIDPCGKRLLNNSFGVLAPSAPILRKATGVAMEKTMVTTCGLLLLKHASRVVGIGKEGSCYLQKFLTTV